MRYIHHQATSYGIEIFFLLSFFVVSLCDASSTFAQQIGAPEFLENANPSEHLIVDGNHAFASDMNPGTSDLPFLTIEKAVHIAKLNRIGGLATKITIMPGTYRESIDLIFPPEERAIENAPIIMIEGAEVGKVIISGSEIWSEWEETNRFNVFVHAWPFEWGESPFPEQWPSRLNGGPVLRRREMVFMNNMPLKQVFSEEEMGGGTFFVSEKDQQIFLSPREGAAMEGSIIEVAIRPKLLIVNGTTNLVLRKLIFQHANNPIQKSAAIFTDVKNLLFEDCWFRWNNWTGYQLFRVEQVTGRRNSANYNGGAGMIGTQIRSFLSEEQLTAYNNWRGARGGLFFWGVAGGKYLGLHDAIIRRQRAISNHAGGLWFDTDNQNVLIEKSRWCGNLQYGLFIEATQGPMKIADSKIFHNEWAGLHLMTSENVTLQQSQIFDNGRAAISVSSRTKRRIQNWETLQPVNLETGAWTLKDNIISGDRILLVLRSESFVNTLESDENVWIHPHEDFAFLVREHSSNQLFNLPEWQQSFQQDGNSVFQKRKIQTMASSQHCFHEMIPYWIGLESVDDAVKNRSDTQISVQ